MTFPFPTKAAFAKLTATEWNAMVGAVNALGKPGWTGFVPTFTASGGGFSLGTGTVGSEYRRSLTNGDMIIYRGTFTRGGSTNMGTGYLRVNLPVTASALAVVRTVCPVEIGDISAQNYPGGGRFESSTSMIFDGPSGVVTATTPMVWATGDTLTWTMEYEAA